MQQAVMMHTPTTPRASPERATPSPMTMPPTTVKPKMHTQSRSQRPLSHQSIGPTIATPVSAASTRKVFNCVIDDSALVAGVKRSTRNGIRQWVKNGQIRLFVPLHALDELSRQKANTQRHGEDVRETLQWLDDATTKFPHAVTLQGADETYETWAEVERFAVPRTLFSERNHHYYDHDTGLDTVESTGPPTAITTTKSHLPYTLAKDCFSSEASNASRSLSPSSLRSAHSNTSPFSPPTSPTKVVVSFESSLSLFAAQESHSYSHSSTASVPLPLQPLFNYILWRVHQENDPAAALESFIFLCNDQFKVEFAKGFDIRTKRLEQLREAVGREDRDYKNRMALLNREKQTVAPAQSHDLRYLQRHGRDECEADNAQQDVGQNDGDESDDEEVVFKSHRSSATILPTPQANVIDPNAFGRGQRPQSSKGVEGDLVPPSPRQHFAPTHRGSPRGQNSLPFNPRGGMRGRGVARGIAPGRGNSGGRGGFPGSSISKSTAETSPSSGQIDPDSFARSGPRGPGRGARGGRKLWVPT